MEEGGKGVCLEEGAGILDAEIIFQGKRIQLRKLKENTMVCVRKSKFCWKAKEE